MSHENIRSISPSAKRRKKNPTVITGVVEENTEVQVQILEDRFLVFEYSRNVTQKVNL